MTRKTATLIGAAVGISIFLGIALLPSMLYGGYAGVLLAGGILGTPLKATLLARSLIVMGMVLGTVGVAGLFTVAGAAVGAAASVIVESTELGAKPSEDRAASGE